MKCRRSHGGGNLMGRGEIMGCSHPIAWGAQMYQIFQGLRSSRNISREMAPNTGISRMRGRGGLGVTYQAPRWTRARSNSRIEATPLTGKVTHSKHQHNSRATRCRHPGTPPYAPLRPHGRRQSHGLRRYSELRLSHGLAIPWVAAAPRVAATPRTAAPRRPAAFPWAATLSGDTPIQQLETRRTCGTVWWLLGSTKTPEKVVGRLCTYFWKMLLSSASSRLSDCDAGGKEKA